jgi:O-antigen ligase
MHTKVVQKDLANGDKQKTPLGISLLLPFFFLLLSFSHSRQLCDMDLAPRLMLLSFFVGLAGFYFAIIAFKKASIDLDFSKNPLFLSFSFWILFQLWSSNQSINRGDAVFEDSKLLLIYASLFVLLVILKKCHNPLYLIAQSICISVIVALFYFFVSLDFHHKSIFTIANEPSFGAFLFANHSNKNSFAEFLLLATPLLCYLVFQQNKVWRYLALLVLLIVLVLLFILKSAAVLLAFLLVTLSVSVVYFFWKYKTSRKKMAAFVFLFLAIAALFIGTNKTIQERMSSVLAYSSAASVHTLKLNSVVERALLWKSSVLMIKEKPLAGVGLSNWKLLYPIYGDPNEKNILADSLKPTRPHNDYLQFWSEAGLGALLAFLGIFILATRHLLQKLHSTSDSALAIQYFVILAGLLAYAIVCFFGYTSERPFNLLLLTSYVALCIHYTSTIVKKNKMQGSKFTKLSLALILVLISTNGISVNLNRIKDEALLMQAIQSKRKTDYSSMLTYLKKINADNFPIDYTATPIKWYLATAYYATGNGEAAQKNYLDALAQAPNHIQLLTDVGVIYDQSNQKQVAEEYYKKALALNPIFKEAIYNYCALKFNSGKVSEAYALLSTLPAPLNYQHQAPKTLEFKKVILLALRDSVINEKKYPQPDSAAKAKLSYEVLLQLDSIAVTQKLEIKDLILKKLKQ